jgi:hypothetical protein
MQTRKDLLEFIAIAALVGLIAFTTTTSDVFSQTSDTNNKGDYGNNNNTVSKLPQDDSSSIHWVSTSESTTILDDEEADGQGEGGQGTPETMLGDIRIINATATINATNVTGAPGASGVSGGNAASLY